MSNYKIQRLTAEYYSPAILFIEKIFNKEQNIPKNLIPIASEDQMWWGIKDNNEIIGTVAAWKDKDEWHWGRLAVHQKLRGLGMGGKLVDKSINELFQMEIGKIKIDARDITVEMILNRGGKTIGAKYSFFGHPITPMILEKEKRV